MKPLGIFALIACSLSAIVGTLNAQSQSKLIPSLRPNTETKFDVRLPWVSEYAPPPIYEKWWKEIAACEKVILPLELTRAVHFVQVNAPNFRRGPLPEALYGYTDGASITIILAEGVILNKSIVQHEMQHLLDYWNGIDEGFDYHPSDRFETCGLHTAYP